MHYLIGGAGVPNYGDELIIRSWVDWYQSALGHASSGELIVAGASQPVLKSLLEDDFPRLKLSDSVARARYKLGKISFVEAVKIGLNFFDKRPSGEPFVALASELEDVSSFHLHGGGYLNDKWPSHGFTLGLGAALAKRAGTTSIATGIGLGPFAALRPAEEGVLADAFRAYALLEVRDDWSYEWVKRIAADAEVHLGLDDCFVQPVSEVPIAGAALHISLIGDAASAPVLERLPGTFVGEFDKVYFWLCTPQDAASFSILADRFRNVEPVWVRGLVEGIPVGETNFMLTQRFHPHIIGARLGMQGIVKVRSAYYDIKHSSVFALGSKLVREGNVGRLGSLESLGLEGSGPSSESRALDTSRVTGKRERFGKFLFSSL